MNILAMTSDAVQYTGRSGRALLHHSVEDKMQFDIDIRLLYVFPVSYTGPYQF
jgi:hypothetical protein